MPAHATSNLPGYEFVSRVGRGAGATISLALETATRREVAIKHVMRRGPDDDRFIVQAENEFEVAHRLEHAYLRRCFDLVRVRRWLKTLHLFLIMEYVDGVRLEDRRPTEIGEILGVFRRIALGLQALHAVGYAHADIKPNNVLLTPGGGLKIIDFGQSCPLGHVKSRVQGTPDYIAPEQVLRKPIDQRTDVFNLGATMYWTLTGKYFVTMIQNAPAGAKRIEIESRRANAPPHELNPNVPVSLSRLALDCCEPNPDRRPRDMAQFLSRLEVIEHVLQRRPDDTDETAMLGA
jgi:serine/threonine-protein kinase